MIKVVCLGGGNAMPKAVLEGLKQYPGIKISAISAMLDSGGTAGKERELFKTGVSFGDIRRAALALSEAPQEKKELFSLRFNNGITLANSYCTNSSLSIGVKELPEELKIDLAIPEDRQVLPATINNATLCAVLENGEIIKGETNIDIPKHDANLKIKKVFLEPEVKAYDPALQAIKEANLVVIGPGDLYSSLSQILLTKGMPEAIRKSKARKIYVCNLMNKRGETDNFSVLDFTFEIERWLGAEADYVIYNNQKPTPQRLTAFKKKHPELTGLVKFYDILDKDKFIGANLLPEKGEISHNPQKLVKIILNQCLAPCRR